jgi:CRP-like cAMP-binding protein
MTSLNKRKRTSPQPFDAQRFLESTGAKRTRTYRHSDTLFSQGDPAASVMYIQQGGVKLWVLSATGKETVVAMLGQGDFFGEGCLAGQPLRMVTATALTETTVLVVAKQRMIQMLRKQSALSELFIHHVLTRNIRIEEELVDQLFNSTEKRLARTLLLLARYGKKDKPERVLPKVSDAVLAEIAGTAPSQVNSFMNKFRELGFIEDEGGLTINTSLLSVALHD